MLKNCIFLILMLIFSCKRQDYLPKEDNAFLASLRLSENLRLEEEFDKEVFDYSLKVPSTLEGFFVICIADNPSSKCTVYIQDVELSIPYVKILPILPNFTIKILVTSPNGNTQNYTVNVSVV